jgi:hypothetical protein
MKKKLYKGYFVGLLMTPAILLILPANFFDKGQSMCLSVLLFDRECYGCGMVRAIQHLIHLDFSVAYELNKLSIIVFSLLVFYYFKEIIRSYHWL